MRVPVRGSAAFPLACLAAFLTAPLVPAPAEAATSARFDGSWGIEVQTREGTCDPLYRYYVVIDEGAVRVRSMSGQTAAAPSGQVRSSGQIDTVLGSAQDPVQVRGRLASATGEGTWSAPSRGCAGSWTASKRG